MTPGTLLILSGPSGVGKDTVIDAWKRRNPRIERVVAYTTREPRAGERNGVDYQFVSAERFHQHVAEGDFLEWKEVHGNFYATPLRDMERMLADGRVAILKIDVQGALAAVQVRPDALTIFLMPPSIEELEDRIRGRASDAPEAIVRRLRTAVQEIESSGWYAHRVVNDDVDRCVDQLEAILRAHECK